MNNEFGTPNTMGELIRILELIEGGECSPDVMARAKSRHEEIKKLPAYRRLVEYANTPQGGVAPSS